MSSETLNYYVVEHGILFIVMEEFCGAFGTSVSIEDSSWESREKADQHCEALNEKLNANRVHKTPLE